MWYGIYQNVRDSAWRCLTDFQIVRLPVDVLAIARAAGIHVVKNSDIGLLRQGESGKTYCNGSHWTIVYDDSNPISKSRYTIAHELGHIFLGHSLSHARYLDSPVRAGKPPTEDQSDFFARRLLCPACVLWGLRLHTAQEIAQICGVDLAVAEERAQRMRVLYKRNKFLTSPLEQTVFEQFQPYIQQQLSANDRIHNKNKTTRSGGSSIP